MILAIDIETEGLDATKFILACTIKEKGLPKIWYNKRDLWEYLLKQGEKCVKNKKVLNIYAHNHEYDFYGYANLHDTNLKIYCTNPFIATYKNTTKESIKFLDTLAIYKMSLKEAATLINMKKEEMPQTLLNKPIEELNKWELKDIEQYCIQDTKIVLELVKAMRTRLKRDNIPIRRMYTINQIAANNLMYQWRQKEQPYLMYQPKQLSTIKTRYAEDIHTAYRGGRIETYQTGKIPECTYIDQNSRYPYSATQIKCPDLWTERKVYEPLKIYNQKTLLNNIGINRCVVTNDTNKLGVLPVRTPTTSYYPGPQSIIVGTWTNMELLTAIQEGYTIHHIQWSILYDQAPQNYLKPIMTQLYQKRTQALNDFDYYFYKQLMNGCLGKLAQYRTNQQYVVDSVEKAIQYKKDNWAVVRGMDYNYLYVYKPQASAERKPYYTPIIPTLVNAHARVQMYQELRKIPYKDLVYTDTDSIIFQGDHLNKFKLGTQLGEWKIEEQQKTAIIYGKKTYSIGSQIKAAGIHPGQITPSQFEEGQIEGKQMITIKIAHKQSEIGTFEKLTRNLKNQLEDHKKAENILQNQKLYIDHDLIKIEGGQLAIKPLLPTIKQLEQKWTSEQPYPQSSSLPGDSSQPS